VLRAALNICDLGSSNFCGSYNVFQTDMGLVEELRYRKKEVWNAEIHVLVDPGFAGSNTRDNQELTGSKA